MSARDQALLEHHATRRADADGHYRFENLPAGTYDVWAESAGWVNSGTTELAATTEMTTIVPDLKLTEGGKLMVRVLNPHTQKPIDFQREARLVLLVRPFGKLTHRSFLPQASELNEEGLFEFRVLPGDNEIQFVSLETAFFEVPSYSTELRVTRQNILESETAEIGLEITSAQIDVLLPPSREITAKVEEAQRLFGNGQFQSAISLLDPVIADHPRLVLPRMLRAQACESLGQIPRAIEQYEHLLRSDPPMTYSFLVRNNLAFLLATAADKSFRDGQRAVKLAAAAVKLSGGAQPDTYDTLAAAYAEIGNFERAIEIQQRAIELAPDNKTFHDHLELFRSNRAFGNDLPDLKQ